MTPDPRDSRDPRAPVGAAPHEPFGRWLRRTVGRLSLAAGMILLGVVLVRPCGLAETCDPRDTLFLFLPVLPLVIIGVITVLGERDRDRSDR